MTQLSGRDVTQNAVFLVATLGFDERERSALRDLLRVSEYRAPAFRALVKEAGAFPHIVIVNPERPDALAKWEALRRGSEGKDRISGILWGNHQPSQPWKYALPRPALVTEVIALLDRVVAEEHGYQEVPGTHARGAGLFAISSREMKPLPIKAAAVEPLLVEPPSASAAAATAAVAAATAAPTTAATAAPADAAITATAPTASGPDYISTVIIEPPGEIAVVLEATFVPPSAPTPTASAAPEKPNIPARNLASEARVSHEVVRSRQPSPAQARFLVVDDSLPVRIQMKDALQRFAKTIDFAQDGEQALILIDNCKYDVIFLDVILPGKDGYDVCRYIRNHPLQRQTPVIMLTGNSAPADRVKGKLAGCDTYLIKPVRQSVLTEVIGEFIKAPAVA